MRGTEEVTAGQPLNTSQPDAGNGRSRSGGAGPLCLLFLGITAITVAAYSPVLFNFFAGDDFVHLTWLKDAVVNPELIWRNFHSSWLDGTTTKFYRPLISVFMVSDYLLWHINGLGFHITNLFFHLTGSLFLLLIMRELTRKLSAPSNWLWPACTAGMFALYPLHPEAVSWITGRVDSIVTAFCLAAIWCYMRWQSDHKHLILVAGAIVCFILGLLSKEMAITVPAVLVAWELTRRTSIKNIAVHTAPFWVTVALYFVVRRFALGTFVGGYDDSLFFIADIKAFLLGWLHAARMTIVPINRELIGVHSLWTKMWELFLLVSTAFAAVSFYRNKDTRPAVLFLWMWLVLCLIPVYKIFAIADDLQGSRLAYLSTVPLSGLLVFGICTLGVPPLRVALAGAVTLLSGFLLWTNNQPWRQAGLEANAIRSSLGTIYASVNNDPQTLLIGLPDHINGAYVSRNALWGMLKQPQFSKDVKNCLMINGFDPIQPFGHLKESLAASRNDVKIYRWSAQRHALEPVYLPTNAGIKEAIALPLPVSTGTAPADQRPFAVVDASAVPCWNVDFVQVELSVKQPGKTGIGADLLFANSLSPEFQLANRTHAPMESKAGSQVLVFALRGLSSWSFGSNPARLKLLLPPGCQATVVSVKVIPPSVLMPQLSFANDGYLGSKGYLHIGGSQNKQTLSVDAGTVPNATTTQLELTRDNLQFEEQNCRLQSKRCGRLINGPLKGFIELSADEFKAPGLYQARLWAKDASGKTIGVASDHVNIAVD
jgi:hypothetical protein